MLQGYLHNGFATRTRSHNHIQSLPLCSKYRPQLSISISSRVFQPGGEEPMPRIGQFRRTTQYNSLSALLAALTSSPFPRQPTSISLALSAIYLCGKQQLLLLLVTFPSPDRPDISSRIAGCTSGVKRGDTVRALYQRDSECREYSANPSISWMSTGRGEQGPAQETSQYGVCRDGERSPHPWVNREAFVHSPPSARSFHGRRCTGGFFLAFETCDYSKTPKKARCRHHPLQMYARYLP